MPSSQPCRAAAWPAGRQAHARRFLSIILASGFALTAAAAEPVSLDSKVQEHLAASQKQALADLHLAGQGQVTPPPPPAPQPLGNAADLCYPPDPSYVLSMPPNDDGSSALIPLPFTFDLYGDSYNSVYINNNGNVSFVDPYATFTPDGFPNPDFRMVAAFWADVDTRAGLGTVKHKVFSNKLVVTWDNVGYYSQHGNLLNTFQLIISDGTDPQMGIGNNICFCYGDMQWTTGDASGGIGGFGGSPATVGANKGDGVSYFQVGRFDHPGVDFDGAYGNNDGVSWLDGQLHCINQADPNLPPVPENFPPNDELFLPCGGALDHEVRFTGPEGGQIVNVLVVDVDGASAQGLVITNTPGNPARVRFEWSGGAAAGGDYHVDMEASDDFNPPGITPRSLVIHVEGCNEAPTCTAGGPAASSCRSATVEGGVVEDADGDGIDFTWSSDNPDVSVVPPSGSLAPGVGPRALPPVDAVLAAGASACHANAVLTLTVNDGNGGSSSCTTAVTFHDDVAPVVSIGGGGGGAFEACLWPPNHAYQCFSAGDLGLLVVDACSEPVTWAIVGCSSDQPDDAPDGDVNGDGHTADDCVLGTDGSSFCVRSERAGSGPSAQAGRTYTVTVAATDACGNVSNDLALARIHVAHDRSPREAGCIDVTRTGCRDLPCAPRL
jgi:hypothetical protein